MLIDLHTHTYPCSACSRMSAATLIETAMRQGLDAICVTDHYAAWGGRDAQALAREKYGFPVFRGLETSTTLGHVLVFGVDEDFPEGVDGPELLRYVHNSGGAAVLAHPFRQSGGWGLWQWLGQQGLGLDAALASRPELACVSAVETFNGDANGDELARAEELARLLGLPVTGGSDAHSVDRVGVTVTEFIRPIGDERELVAEIRAGRIRPLRRA